MCIVYDRNSDFRFHLLGLIIINNFVVLLDRSFSAPSVSLSSCS